MAYYYDPLLDPNRDPNAEQPQLAGASQVMGGASNPTPETSNTAKPSSSNTFQNLNDYLSANKGNGFGEQFASKVNEDVDKAGQAQNEASQSFKSQVDNSVPSYDSNLASSAISNPTEFVKDPNNISNLQKQATSQYQGPSSYLDSSSNYQKAYGATKKAQDVTGGAQTEAGRFSLLNNYFGRPSYTQGEKSLDNLLVQGDQGAQASLAQAKANSDIATRNFEEQSRNLSDYAAQAKGQAAKNSAQTYKDMQFDPVTQVYTPDSAYQKSLSQLDADVASKQAGKQSEYDSLMSPLLERGPNLPSYRMFKEDPNQFLSYTDPTRGNVNDPETRARISALEQIAGLAPTQFDSSQAGYQFNQPGFENALKKDQLAYQRDVMNSFGPDESAKIRALNQRYGLDAGTLLDNLASYKGKSPNDLWDISAPKANKGKLENPLPTQRPPLPPPKSQGSLADFLNTYYKGMGINR